MTEGEGNGPKNVVVIAGPTGSGETTLTNALLTRFPKTTRLVTATTRPPRDHEREGIDYHFFSKEDFLRLIETGEILEHTHVTNRDVYYGSYAPDLHNKLAAGRIVIVNSDIVGARFYKEHYNATTVFIEPETIDHLILRIRHRSPDLSEDEIEKRRKNAERELQEEAPFYDYRVRNDDGKLDESVAQVVEILEKEGYTLE